MVKLLAAFTVLALALPAMAQDAEVGMEYEITIESEQDNPYTGPFGQVRIGTVLVAVPDAKVGERYMIRVTDIRNNSYTGDRQASCEFQQVDGDRTGNCVAAP